jgi:hypothetical protein
LANLVRIAGPSFAEYQSQTHSTVKKTGKETLMRRCSLLFALAALFGLSACGSDEVPQIRGEFPADKTDLPVQKYKTVICTEHRPGEMLLRWQSSDGTCFDVSMSTYTNKTTVLEENVSCHCPAPPEGKLLCGWTEENVAVLRYQEMEDICSDERVYLDRDLEEVVAAPDCECPEVP